MSGARPPAAQALALAAAGQALSVLATLAGASALVLWLVSRAEGDAADLLVGELAQREAMLQALALDQPLGARWLAFWRGALAGELGVSWTVRPGEPVAGLLTRSMAASAPLLLGAAALNQGLALALAWGQGRSGRLMRRAWSLVSVSPAFLLAWGLIFGLNSGAYVALQHGWIPRPGWFALPDQDSGLKLALAAGVLGVGSSALAEVQAALGAELGRLRAAPFVEALQARGAPTTRALLHNLAPAAAAVGSSRAALLVGGLVVVEKVLHLNGAGALLWQACRLRDLPLAMGLTVAAAVTVCAARLGADQVRLMLDPRLRGRT